MRISRTIVLFLILPGACGKKEAPAPSLGAASALRPHFMLQGGGDFEAGTAYAARTAPGTTPLLFTAVHLLGPAGGLKDQLSGNRLATEVLGVNLAALGNSKALAGVGRRPRILDGTPSSRTGARDDVVAFDLDPGFTLDMLLLAGKNPEVGEPVWLVGDESHEGPEAQKLWPAQVVEAGLLGTAVQFASDVKVDGFSGAPFVNAEGEVVGHLVAGGKGNYAIMTGAGDIRRHLVQSGIK